MQKNKINMSLWVFAFMTGRVEVVLEFLLRNRWKREGLLLPPVIREGGSKYCHQIRYVMVEWSPSCFRWSMNHFTLCLLISNFNINVTFNSKVEFLHKFYFSSQYFETYILKWLFWSENLEDILSVMLRECHYLNNIHKGVVPKWYLWSPFEIYNL